MKNRLRDVREARTGQYPPLPEVGALCELLKGGDVRGWVWGEGGGASGHHGWGGDSNGAGDANWRVLQPSD